MPPSVARPLAPSLARPLVSALGAAALPWEADDGGNPSRDLLAAGTAAFARASSAVLTLPTSAQVVGANTPRDRANGSRVIEPYRYNHAQAAGHRDFQPADGWTGPTAGTTYTSGVADGPDGAVLTANRIQVTSGNYGPNRNVGGAGSTAMSLWVRAPSGSGSAQILTGWTGVYGAKRATLDETWQYITAAGTGSAGAGFASVGDARAIGGGTIDAIDCLADLCTIVRTRYMVSSVYGLEAQADVWTWPASEIPLELREGRSEHRWHPCDASTQVDAGDTRVLFSVGGAADRLEVYSDAGVIKVRVLEASAVVVESTAIAWAGDQTATSAPISVVCDAAAGTITISGATSGNGTYTGTPWAWPGGASARVGGVYGAASEIGGSIYRPRRV